MSGLSKFNMKIFTNGRSFSPPQRPDHYKAKAPFLESKERRELGVRQNMK